MIDVSELCEVCKNRSQKGGMFQCGIASNFTSVPYSRWLAVCKWLAWPEAFDDGCPGFEREEEVRGE